MGHTTKLIRNSSGIITSTIQIIPQLSPVDTVVTIFHYNAGKYTSSVASIAAFGFTSLDSTVYTYDGSGRIKDETYESFAGLPYELYQKNEYTYSASGNLAIQKQFDYDPSTSSYDELYALSFSFDTKVNPLILGNESIFIYSLSYIGPNNVTGYNYAEPGNPINNSSSVLAYTYDSDNKPLTATQTFTPGGGSTTVTYYYQYFFRLLSAAFLSKGSLFIFQLYKLRSYSQQRP